MNMMSRLFEQRVRGFRLIEIIGVILAVTVFMWVTVSKALVRDDISHLNEVNSQIEQELKAVSELRVRVANLERPSRLEALAKQELGMAPADPKREASLDSIAELSKTSQRPVSEAAEVVSADSIAAKQGLQVTTTQVAATAPAPAQTSAKPQQPQVTPKSTVNPKP